MLDPKQTGNLTELRCITAFCELGCKVSIPYGENTRYDFIADINNKLIRVQVKTCKEIDSGTTISFPCRSTRVNSKGNISRKYTKKEIDYFCTFYKGKCYLVPVEECSHEKKLRFTKTQNNQKNGDNYAEDYELHVQVCKINGE